MPAPDTDWFPMSPLEHEAQLRGVLRALGNRPARVLDLGCGDGRLAGPLAQHGHRVTAIDADERAVRACRDRDPRIDAHRADMLDPAWSPVSLGPFDAAMCVGNTLMLVHEVDRAADLLARVRESVVPGGVLLIDDVTAHWADVADGNWQSGVSEDGQTQLVWAAGDNVVALRHGDAVDERSWNVREGDRLHRLWSMGELRLLARVSGWLPPEILDACGLVAMARPR